MTRPVYPGEPAGSVDPAFLSAHTPPESPWDFTHTETATSRLPAAAVERGVPTSSASRAVPRARAVRAVAIAIAALVVVSGLFAYAMRPAPVIRVAGIASANEVVVSSPLSGRLDALLVDEGAAVQSGALIGRMDARELRLERSHEQALRAQLVARLAQTREQVGALEGKTRGAIMQAEAEASAARGDREQAQSELAQRQADVERGRTLGAQGLLSRQELEQLETALRTASARVEALEQRVRAADGQFGVAQAAARDVFVAGSDVEQTQAQIRQADAAIARVEARLKDAEIRAPLGGVVSLRVARSGEIIRAGDPIVTIVDPSDTWVRVEVDETRATGVAVGQSVTVELPTGERIDGRISLVETEGEFATQRDVSRRTRDVRTIGFRVALPNTGGRVHPGMTAYVLLPAEAP